MAGWALAVRVNMRVNIISVLILLLASRYVIRTSLISSLLSSLPLLYIIFIADNSLVIII